MKVKGLHIVVFCFLMVVLLPVLKAQNPNQSRGIVLRGSVVEEKTYAPISGVEVLTDGGAYTRTDGLGEFVIKAQIGDQLIFQSPDFEMVIHRITSNEDIRLVVENYQGPVQKGRTSRDASHQQLLDSANYHKKNDIEKSIDFIAQSISVLGKNPNKRLLARSLTNLGEIYLYHQQFDLAIGNFEDALTANKTIKTQLLLGEALLLDKQYPDAERELKELLDKKKLVPYQRINLYEFLGDTKKGMGEMDLALEYYEEGLRIAKKNQVTPKVTDLTSKIAETYALADRRIEAEGYFDSSLELSKKESPKRAIQESEKVADFYNRANRYSDEIKQRKSSLNELNKLGDEAVVRDKGIAVEDTITSQRINYKIGRAYVAQNRLNEAIPYLQKSIVEADSEDDLLIQKEATRKLSEVYEYKGDFSKAFETYQDYVTLVDTLYVRKEQEISRLARLNREIATKQNRISSLEQERELSQSKYNLALTEQQLFETRTKWQTWLIYSLIFAMLLLALTVFFFYRTNKQQKLTNNLLALKSLRSQMNPHFIFNALNSVNNYIAKNDERSANRFLSEFSVLMRTVLENSEEDFIPFSKELELLKLYVKLEHSRFTEKFDYRIDVDDDIRIEEFEIPPMLIQPYVENAIWHGLRYKKDKGFLNITVNQPSGSLLTITITDDGIGRKKSAELKTQNQRKQKSKGMGNITKRIGILNEMYSNKVSVSISDLTLDKTGTKVVVKLKKD
ncbi:histidine kinase [Muricauda sp. SCSIO 64092]|uniref:histidine kinase n=1 Tax=Allomuricauda sp. SCSIO 64092 TaxID=2908842 RepID=UPI001FF1457D|nr:histidine kinase [Muricauda sp. SCSIO 64092]UOY07819.1 histidine kinase [Muricauda sp. SCSIO 64092]